MSSEGTHLVFGVDDLCIVREDASDQTRLAWGQKVHLWLN